MQTRSSPRIVSSMWICAAVMAALGLYLLVSASWQWWRIGLGVLLLLCPVMTIWLACNYGRDTESLSRNPSSKEIHRGS